MDNKQDIKRQLAEIKREMRENNVRRISPFNGGLSATEYRYNAKLFELETLLRR